ncbi:MAG: DUF5615 family PIN-like protein [Lentisphaerae bacterium]|nr:DUF5615 family PIN-like protein [Lentisphaerota bacterium]
MRFLVDAQLPPALADWIQEKGYEAKAVRDMGLRDASDTDIWKFADQQKWVIVTKDEDFINFSLQASAPPGLVWIRIGNCANELLFTWLDLMWQDIVHILTSGETIVEIRRP